MKIQVDSNGYVSVNGVPRRVDTSSLHADIEAAYYDTVLGKGRVQYFDTVLVSMQERDFEAEKVAEDYARERNLKSPTDPIYKTIQVPKPDTQLGAQAQATFQPWYDRWVAAEPLPPPAPPAPDPRLVEIDQNLSSGLIGGLTRDQLKALSVAEYNTWFNATFTTNAQLIGLLRRLTLLVIRRLL